MRLADHTLPPSLTTSPRTLKRAPGLEQSPAAFRAALWIIARNWRYGSLTVVLPTGAAFDIVGSEPGLRATLIVRDFGFMRRALARGDTGFAEGFMAGEWDTPDLPVLLGAFGQNWDRLHRLVMGHPLVQVANRVGYLLRSNSRSGARRNIHAHYDLGNAFYSRWLDASMTYSSALYERPEQPLAAAQANKYRSLARGMELQPGHRLLEIGCGWGGFAEFAAREVGAQVTAITISKAQYEFARKRMFEQGLTERADIWLVDYRDVEGEFDRVASIEMFEAVGERYWPAYFGRIRERLTPDGRAGLQIITIRDEFFASYRRRADFIQNYIFPGGMLPSEARLRQEIERAGLVWGHALSFGQHYAETLAQWAKRFDAAWEDIRVLGFDERFRRLWRFYLGYCEAGFRGARTDVIQLNLAKA